jgi:hypothetical protein
MEIEQATLISSNLRANGNDVASFEDRSVPRTAEVLLELPGTPVDPNEALAAELKGRVMHVPNMMLAMHGWPHRERNKYYEQMRSIFDETLDR